MSSHLYWVQPELEDCEEHFTVEPLLHLQILLQLQHDLVQIGLAVAGRVDVFTPVTWHQILHHCCAQLLPLTVDPEHMGTANEALASKLCASARHQQQGTVLVKQVSNAFCRLCIYDSLASHACVSCSNYIT